MDEIVNMRSFKTFNVAFSNSLKNILNVPMSSSSHAVAAVFNQLLFHHYVNFIQIRYFKRIFRSCNPVLKILRFDMKNGYLYRSVSKRVNNLYNCDIILNDVDALRSRVYWVQNHEPRTGFPLLQR